MGIHWVILVRDRYIQRYSRSRAQRAHVTGCLPGLCKIKHLWVIHLLLLPSWLGSLCFIFICCYTRHRRDSVSVAKAFSRDRTLTQCPSSTKPFDVHLVYDRLRGVRPQLIANSVCVFFFERPLQVLDEEVTETMQRPIVTAQCNVCL